ncbi:MAG: WG repeat-containing protein, partial [Bacteroidota bacterium]
FGENLIDKKGNLLFRKNLESINRHLDDILVTYNDQGSQAYDKNLDKVLNQAYQSLDYLGSGFFMAREKNTLSKILLKDGLEIKLDNNFWRVGKAVGNRILVDYIVERKGQQVTTKSGIINERGEWIVEPKYDFAMPRVIQMKMDK